MSFQANQQTYLLKMKYYSTIIVLLIALSFLSTVQTQIIKANLDSVEISISEKDQLSPKYDSIEYPAGLAKTLECDSSHKLSIRFNVRDSSRSEDISVQQAMIFFSNSKTGHEVAFVVDQDRTSKIYSKDINLNYKGRDFNYQSGDYSIRLIAADANLQKSIDWILGKVNIQFTQEPIVETDWLERYSARPEIIHQFRKAEKRPPVIVSHTFTILCLSPVLIMVYFWSKIGLNLSKFSFSLSAFIFHGSLLLIFVLYTLFFIQMQMFTLMKCLSGALISTFISGHFLLKNLSIK